ncbi:MAG TPA: L,D-transpeptidase family protein, partial [Pseudolabrys sp.]|nr:L,D-transpeptidase family protein [Pseudolabrys sp.]
TIIANMERWRWLPRDLGTAHVIVNIPDFTLGVYKDGGLIWHTRIVVGKPGNLATPLLSETMKYLTINPTWNVPPSIIRNEYLPALERDPDALERIGLRVGYNQDGSLRVYQPPGDRNALGRIRFNFPNPFLVYQHDTPDKKLFARDSRAFSHGCMRVQNPEQYAEVLLSLSQPEENYTIARIRSLYGNQEHTINLRQPIPVHVTYQTAFVDENGQLNFRHDIYGLDAAVLKLMHGDERMIADTPIARPRNTSSKPVMARLPQHEDREWQGQYQYRGGGWFGFGEAERAYASSPYRSRSPYRPFNHADGIW